MSVQYQDTMHLTFSIFAISDLHSDCRCFFVHWRDGHAGYTLTVFLAETVHVLVNSVASFF